MIGYGVTFAAGLVVGWWFFPAPAWAVTARDWVYTKIGFKSST